MNSTKDILSNHKMLKKLRAMTIELDVLFHTDIKVIDPTGVKYLYDAKQEAYEVISAINKLAKTGIKNWDSLSKNLTEV